MRHAHPAAEAMKTCDSFKTSFSAYIDQQLFPDDRAEVEEHIRTCPACFRELSELQRTHEALLLLGRPLKPRPALAAVRARIRQDEQRRRRARWLWLPAPIAGAALAGLLAFSFVRPVSFQPAGEIADAGRESADPAVVAPENPSVPAAVQPDSAAAALPKAAADIARPAPAKRPAVRIAQSPVRPHARAVKSIAPAPVLESPADLLPDAAAAGVEQSVMVVASRPAVNYCAVAHDPVSGAQVSEVSVRRTYAADGSVRAHIVLHFPPPDDVENNDTENSIPNNRPGSRPAADPGNRV